MQIASRPDSRYVVEFLGVSGRLRSVSFARFRRCWGEERPSQAVTSPSHPGHAQLLRRPALRHSCHSYTDHSTGAGKRGSAAAGLVGGRTVLARVVAKRYVNSRGRARWFVGGAGGARAAPRSAAREMSAEPATLKRLSLRIPVSKNCSTSGLETGRDPFRRGVAWRGAAGWGRGARERRDDIPIIIFRD